MILQERQSDFHAEDYPLSSKAAEIGSITTELFLIMALDGMLTCGSN